MLKKKPGAGPGGGSVILATNKDEVEGSQVQGLPGVW